MRNLALQFLNENLVSAYLESYGVIKQFIELGLSNSKYELIKFYIDCKIFAENDEIERLVAPFSRVSEDTYESVYFQFVNLERVKECEITSTGNLKVRFSNDYVIVFDFSSPEDANLSITFKEKESSKSYRTIDFHRGGEIMIK